MNRKGFTLIEILTAVIILGILAAMAVPMYQKTIEKSYIAEARTVLKQMLDAKLRTMDAMEIDNYSASFGFSQLGLSLPCRNGTGGTNFHCDTKSFRYYLYPNKTGGINNVPASFTTTGAAYEDAVCAVRTGGDAKDTVFLYVGQLTSDTKKFFCWSPTEEGCGTFGLARTGDDNTNNAWCGSTE